MKQVPRAIALTFFGLNVPADQHGKLMDLMASKGDWYALHWQSCGLLEGIISSKMCRKGHKPQNTGEVELNRAQVAELIKDLR